jgi:hypothetical protein
MRASDYPLPDYAVSVWHRGDALAIALPGHSEDGSARTLFIPLDKLPLDAPGWRSFVNLLAERRKVYQANERPRFSTSAEPTEVQMREMLKAHYAKHPRLETAIDADIFHTEQEEINHD